MVRNGATCFVELSGGDQSIDELLYVRFGDLFFPSAMAPPRLAGKR
jgi:hypothetical protein